MPNWLKLFIAVLVCESAGIIGALFTTPNITTWFTTLNKPFFSPPNFIFAPVWTALYLLMGVALYLVWINKNSKLKKIREQGIWIFIVQLVLNILWSLIFFGAHNILLALVVIIILAVLIWETIKSFAKINKNAGFLLYPYLAWVSFATILNFAFWVLNQ